MIEVEDGIVLRRGGTRTVRITHCLIRVGNPEVLENLVARRLFYIVLMKYEPWRRPEFKTNSFSV